MPEAPNSARRKLTGVCAPARGAVIAALVGAEPAPVWLVVAACPRAAEQLAEDTALFATGFGGERALGAKVADLKEWFAHWRSDRVSTAWRSASPVR